MGVAQLAEHRVVVPGVAGSIPVAHPTGHSALFARDAGHRSHVSAILRGALAGAAGTTALNAVTYLDMAWRARPASSTPQATVEKIAEKTGVQIPGDDEQRENRLAGLGALNGLATGVGVAIGVAMVRAAGLRLSAVPGMVCIGATAMAASNASMAALGVTDPRTWSAADWLSDALPHLAYGAIVHAGLRAFER